MIIEETQESGITRVFNLPIKHESRWVEFFDWLVAEGEIISWRVLNEIPE
jgi:hypothetical protein